MRAATGLLAVALVVAPPSAQAAEDSVLQAIAERGTLRLAVRADVAPFSTREQETGRFVGYSVDLCREVAANLGDAIGIALETVMVEVTAETRFHVLRDDEADLLCEATTVTLARPVEEAIDFSLMTFVTGSSFLYRIGAANGLDDSDLHRVGAVSGTTSAEALRVAAETDDQPEGTTDPSVQFPDYPAAVRALNADDIDVLIGDRPVLQALLDDEATLAEGYALSGQYLSYEPYALAMPAGARKFRYHVDQTLADLYRSGEIGSLVLRHFQLADVPQDLAALFRLQALP